MTYTGKRLYKSQTSKMLGGVCGGIAEYFNLDPTLVRLAYAFLSIFSACFPGILLYIVMCIVVPSAPYGQQQQQYYNNQQPPYGNNQQPPQFHGGY